MKAARAPREDKSKVRLLVVENGREGAMRDGLMGRFADHLRPGDLLAVNDAATLPAAFHGIYENGGESSQVEIRLMTQLNERTWRAVSLGAGDWRVPTEHRPAPPRFAEGGEIRIAEDFRARVHLAASPAVPASNRLLDVEFNHSGEALWRDLYRHGKPVQYSYMNGELALWSTQNVYGGRPWAVEMPSAGHALDWRLLLELIRKGVRIAPLTHAAGLSSTGEPTIDRALPLAERYEIPAPTLEAVRQTKAAGGRVIAVGTSVVRALESSALAAVPGDRGVIEGVTELKLGPGFKRRVVDGLLTGTHDVSESHYQLLLAFLPEQALSRVSRRLEEEEYLTHEFGDLCLIFATL
jgi:S-adenosylmethionine:tRNA ribosyltransferase-isomerase